MIDERLKLPFRDFSRKEWLLWIFSMVAVAASNFVSESFSPLTLIAAMIGVTSLIFAAKGNVWGQLLMIAFSIMYGIISIQFHYWGEMVTYMGMNLPMAVWSAVTWFRNPSEQKASEVQIRRLELRHWMIVIISTIAVTIAFYFILEALETPNLTLSTISIATSFMAAALAMMRCTYFALVYALNDIVLVGLWILASFQDMIYIPVAVNFIIFFINDMYTFISWKKRESTQQQ